MTHLNHPNYPMPLENPYTSVDPFRPSIQYSLKNLFTTRRRGQEEATIDNIPLPPPNAPSQRHTRVPSSVFPRRRRRSSSSYRSPPMASTVSELLSVPPPSIGRDTFGMEPTRAHDDGSHSHAPTVKLRNSRTSSPVSPPRSDRESVSIRLPSELGTSSLHPSVSTSGSGQSRESHRQSNLVSDRLSRVGVENSIDPEIIVENRSGTPRRSTDAISYYKPPTRSSVVVLPSSSPYYHIYPIPGLAPATKHEDPISPTEPAWQLHQDVHALTTYILAFLLDTVPRHIYLHLLLRLPYLYFSRVINIFEDAEMSMPEIKKMALEANNYLKDPTVDISKALYPEPDSACPQYYHLSRSWGGFIDSLTREWKTLNIISVLLLSAILTVLQIPSAANEPLTRYSALLSMICALMSLLYGCIYIIRFGTMRSTCKAAEWAHEAQKTTTGIFWNVWVLLAMPAIWLAWAMIFFVVSIMSFVWRTGTIDDPSQITLTSHDVLAPRIIITNVLSLGLVYLVLIASTLRRYGTAMDRAWRTRVLGWMHERFGDIHPDPNRSFFASGSKPPPSTTSRQPPVDYSSQHARNTSLPTPSQPFTHEDRRRGRSSSIKPIPATATFTAVENPQQHPPAERKRVIKLTKILGLCIHDDSASDIPSTETLGSCQMTEDDWERLSSEIRSSWNPDQLSSIESIMQDWNHTFFNKHGCQISLCEELGVPWLKHAIYHFSWKDELPMVTDQYDSIPPNLKRLDILSGDEAGFGRISLFSSRLDVTPPNILLRSSS